MSDGTYQGVGYLHHTHTWSVSKLDAQMQVLDIQGGGGGTAGGGGGVGGCF